MSVCSAASSDILNDTRWLSQSTEVSFGSYVQDCTRGVLSYVCSLISYDKDGNILSSIAKLECSTPREQSSDGILMKGSYAWV